MINLGLDMDGCDQIDVICVSLKIASKISPWQLIEPGTQPGVCQPVRIPQVNMGIDDALGHMRDPIHLGEPSGHAWARHLSDGSIRVAPDWVAPTMTLLSPF